MNFGQELLALEKTLDKDKIYTEEEIKDLAVNKMGFSTIARLSVDTLTPLESIREMCAQDRCGMYDKQWTCPPACGSLEELTEKIKTYDSGYILQHVAKMDDEFDVETMLETERIHKNKFMEFSIYIKSQFDSIFPMPAGACNLCHECTYPDHPCRYPQIASPSMEAAGLFVSDICSKNNVKYYYGERTISFTSCILTRRKENKG